MCWQKRDTAANKGKGIREKYKIDVYNSNQPNAWHLFVVFSTNPLELDPSTAP